MILEFDEFNITETNTFEAIKLLSELTDEERLEVFNKFCKGCGSKNNKCQCWNDE